MLWELLISYCASRIGSCGAQRTLRTHSLLKSAAGRSLRLLEVPLWFSCFFSLMRALEESGALLVGAPLLVPVLKVLTAQSGPLH